MAAAGESRKPGRDRLLILMAFRHALRVSELVDLRWQQVHLDSATVDIRRSKNGTPGIHGLQGDELRLLRALRREHPHADFVFLSERKAPLSVDGAQKLIERLGVAAKLRFPIHAHMLRYAAAGDGPRGVPGARCVTVALARLLVHLSAFFAHRHASDEDHHGANERMSLMSRCGENNQPKTMRPECKNDPGREAKTARDRLAPECRGGRRYQSYTIQFNRAQT